MDLGGKKILLGVSGSIAAYKAADLCSQLSKTGAEVHVVLTRNATQFVGIPTFRALTRNAVLTDLFEEPDTERIAHIALAQSADLILIAPATANILAKMAHGIADDMLSTCLLATPHSTPILIAPAMNTQMWNHPATQANLQHLTQRGIQVIPPDTGLLACQDIGQGKLAETGTLLRAIEHILLPKQTLLGQTLLITAGATREPLDPVRFISNRSSGKMGYAVATSAAQRGAKVVLVSGHTTVAPPQNVEIIRIQTADEMLSVCQANFADADAFIATAAVADYTPKEIATKKIKKEANVEEFTLHLRKTPDILATLARNRRTGQIVIGFAAETENLLENAQTKMTQKGNLDIIVANDILQEGAGFDSDTNIVTLLFSDGTRKSLPKMTKREVAEHLLNAYEALREQRK
jgi:phosphopantothenoylcysteine decarboxylase/phosphopantothenate--cysteine ligase